MFFQRHVQRGLNKCCAVHPSWHICDYLIATKLYLSIRFVKHPIAFSPATKPCSSAKMDGATPRPLPYRRSQQVEPKRARPAVNLTEQRRTGQEASHPSARAPLLLVPIAPTAGGREFLDGHVGAREHNEDASTDGDPLLPKHGPDT